MRVEKTDRERRDLPGCDVQSCLPVTVLEVDLQLCSGQQILVDPGLAVPKYREHHTAVIMSLFYTGYLWHKAAI